MPLLSNIIIYFGGGLKVIEMVEELLTVAFVSCFVLFQREKEQCYLHFIYIWMDVYFMQGESLSYVHITDT